MSTLRKRHLPSGWYPDSAAEAVRVFDHWRERYPPGEEVFTACVVPHAGWTFSGALAFAALENLPSDVETVVVAGGHLPSGGPVLVAPEDAYDTPFGEITADSDLRDRIRSSTRTTVDQLPDNTVEVHLPILRHLLPSARCLSIRCPPSSRAADVGRLIAEYAEHRSVAVVGSTDLTHYGPDYGFEPAGPGAVDWASRTNDARFIDALVNFDVPGALEAANRYRAACSAGAAVTAVVFAHELGCTRAVVIDHFTSHEVLPRDSFVGYAAIGYCERATSR